MRYLLHLALCLPALAQAPSGEELLTAADKFRHPWPNFSVELVVKSRKGEQKWKVRAREDGDARVEGLSEKEKGRTVLVKGDDLWLLVPNAKRPLKVSPQQRLLGPASGGDIARTRFRIDYTVESVKADTREGRPVWVLDLKAKRPALTFQRARLSMDQAETKPVAADFLYISGKLAKTVLFHGGAQASGRTVLQSMDVVDPGGEKAEIRFSAWTPGAHDPALFELPVVK